MKTSDEPNSSHRTDRSRPFWSRTARKVAIFPALLLGMLFFLLVTLPAVGYALQMLSVNYPAVGSALIIFSSEFHCCWECSSVSSLFHHKWEDWHMQKLL